MVPVVGLSVTVPVPEPEAGLRPSHAALSLALQVKVPTPFLRIARVRAAGLLPPCCVVKEKLVGLAPIAGGTEASGVTVKDTGMNRLPPLLAVIFTVAV